MRVYGQIVPARLKALEDGVTIEGVTYEPIKIEVEKEKTEGANSWLAVTIREGKNREVRKVLEHAGLQVTRLIRVAFGPFQLGKCHAGPLKKCHVASCANPWAISLRARAVSENYGRHIFGT